MKNIVNANFWLDFKVFRSKNMSNNINVKPLTFPITLDPFRGYSYGNGQDAIGELDQNEDDEENNLNNRGSNETFNHPLGKKVNRSLHFVFLCFNFIIKLHHLFELYMVYQKMIFR